MIRVPVLLATLARRHGQEAAPTRGARLADWVTAVVGSWPFVGFQALAIMIWVALNYEHVVNFDPYPFILLNLGLSFQAAFTAPFILMSQNRQAEIDRATLREDLRLDQETASAVRTIAERLTKGDATL